MKEELDLSLVGDVAAGLQDVRRALHDEDGFALADGVAQGLARIAHNVAELYGPLERIATALEKIERVPR